jgi:twinkle protein
MTAVLSAKAIRFFEERGISVETVEHFGIHTARIETEGEMRRAVADPAGNVIVFPFLDKGEVVAEKWRKPGKMFEQRKGGKRTFWNADILDDPSVQDGTYQVIVTEGEIDALTAIDCGFPHTVSVPDGAPQPNEGVPDEQYRPVEDAQGKFAFVWNNRERLAKVRRFILATDGDPAGDTLRTELLRRLGAGRCSYVTYSEGCKDLNDVHVKHGRTAVAKLLNEATPFPVKGLYRLNDFPDQEMPPLFSTGWAGVDPLLQLYRGTLMVVTGVPQHGKSLFTLMLCANLSRSHGWKHCLALYETRVKPFVRGQLRQFYLCTSDIRTADWKMVKEADDWIAAHFFFIHHDPRVDDDIIDVDWQSHDSASYCSKPSA